MGTLAMTSLVILAIPFAAVSGAMADDAQRAEHAVELGAELRAVPGATGSAKAPGYLLRCWQYGRLLFEEEVLDAPDGAVRYRTRLNEAERSTIYLLEVNNSLCSVRSSPGTPRKN